MFKFDFQLEETDDEVVVLPSQSRETGQSGPAIQDESGPSGSRACHHVTLDQLLGTLPESISYSPLTHPCLSTPLLRRDLFDARFQLINRPSSSESTSDEPILDERSSGAGAGEEDEYVDAATDLIPGLYEGGLKTWEGGVDLVEVLSSAGKGSEGGVAEWVGGSRVIEIGCGTAVPTAYLLRSLLSRSDSKTTTTLLHLQDYNLLVLQLVTLPNLLLAALPFLPSEALRPADNADDADDAEDIEGVLPDLEQPGNLDITPTLLDAFKSLLKAKNIELAFTFGHWEGLATELETQKAYSLVLTAETIYAEESNAALLQVLESAMRDRAGSDATEGQVHKEEVRLEDSLGELSVKDDWAKTPLRERTNGLALVAAKVLYFGVGGGLQGFLQRVEARGGSWSNVMEWVKGVGRKVVQVGF